MATKKSPVVPRFKDVDKESVTRARQAVASGKQPPLKVPKGAKVSNDKNGVVYRRWPERAVVSQAYRTVTKNGLMDVTIIAKLRQSKENTGARVFGHFYLNLGEDISEGHEMMNDRTYGALDSLLVAIGVKGDILKGAVLDKMFPPKGQPGAESPLNDKPLIANIVQQYGPAKDPNTNKPLKDEDGEPIMDTRDNIESFLPDAAPASPEEDEDEDAEEDEDEDAEEESEEEEGDEDEEEEEEEPAPVKKPSKPANRK